jgi:hypothetical protein
LDGEVGEEVELGCGEGHRVIIRTAISPTGCELVC